MNQNSEQNGRHASPPQFVAPSDPRTRNLSSSLRHSKVCRDYVWGICNRHGQCQLSHKCPLQEMKTIIKFCHDHQSPNGCLRPDCTYLHTSCEEENLFLTTGKLPRVLEDRHAAMNAAANAAVNIYNIENGASPIYMTPPPPPPPPPPPSVPKHIGESPLPHLLRSVPAVLAPPAPPPPPPVEASGVVAAPTTVYTVGPSKRKAVEEKVAGKWCDRCDQQELRTYLNMEKVKRLIRLKEHKKLFLKNKKKENDSLAALLRNIFLSENCSTIEECADEPERAVQKWLDDITDNTMDSVQSTSSPPTSMRDLLLDYLRNSSSQERPSSTQPRSSDLWTGADS